MFDIMILIKIIGVFCGVLLIYFLGGWVVEIIYYMGGGYGYGGEEVKKGYKIEVVVVDNMVVVEEGFFLEEFLVVVDVDKGVKVFGKCKVCYKLDDGVNGIGLYLFNVVNCVVGLVDGFVYFGVMVVVVEIWILENLDGFLISLKGFVSGIKMSFFGLKKLVDCVNLIVYL